MELAEERLKRVQREFLSWHQLRKSASVANTRSSHPGCKQSTLFYTYTHHTNDASSSTTICSHFILIAPINKSIESIVATRRVELPIRWWSGAKGNFERNNTRRMHLRNISLSSTRFNVDRINIYLVVELPGLSPLHFPDSFTLHCTTTGMELIRLWRSTLVHKVFFSQGASVRLLR